jgi:hypothetical protein
VLCYATKNVAKIFYLLFRVMSGCRKATDCCVFSVGLQNHNLCDWVL